MNDVTRILSQIDDGDPQAAEKLLPLVYDELRKLATAKLANEKPGQTLQATALVHEAYLRLVAPNKAAASGRGSEDRLTPDSCPLSPVSWHSRGHFFAAAAEAMRRILIEQARRKKSQKAGGNRADVELANIAEEADSDPLDLLALNEALEKLEQLSPRKAQLVKLRYFAGLTIDQAAHALDISPSTANADWVYAKSWLCLEMRPGE